AEVIAALPERIIDAEDVIDVIRRNTWDETFVMAHTKVIIVEELRALIPAPFEPPEAIEGWEEYDNAPSGTIVAADNRQPYQKAANGNWYGIHNGGFKPHRRKVLRWGA